jgi:hypothetical protein
MELIKNFLKPDRKRIVCLIFISAISSLPNYFWWSILGIKLADAPTLFGFFFYYYGYGGYCIPPCRIIFDLKNLSVDLILWYFLSCLIVYIWEKMTLKQFFLLSLLIGIIYGYIGALVGGYDPVSSFLFTIVGIIIISPCLALGILFRKMRLR